MEIYEGGTYEKVCNWINSGNNDVESSLQCFWFCSNLWGNNLCQFRLEKFYEQLFPVKTSKDINDATSKVITASEVNAISTNITGKTYPSSQIFSSAMVDLSYNQGINVIVDTNKIKVVTPKMYANALRSSGINNGYVVVSSPVTASGEAALAGVLKSYEIAVGAPNLTKLKKQLQKNYTLKPVSKRNRTKSR